jgi:putative transposase
VEDQELSYTVSELCQLLRVSRSGYYKWLKRPIPLSETVNQELMEYMEDLHRTHNGILGYKRMTTWVNKKLGTHYNKKRIRRLMRVMGISSSIRRKRKSCTQTSFIHTEENILNRDFTATAPNQKWCTDVTYLQYGFGKKAYLSAVKDLYDGSIISYEISHHNDNPLVMRTIQKALNANPEAKPLLHSDRGSQYTSQEYYQLTNMAGIKRSMSRVGKCIDNAPIESFFGHFKTEAYHHKTFKTYDELVMAINDYIAFYNSERFQSKLNDLTPLQFRNQVAA